jgi:hypothetical protein
MNRKSEQSVKSILSVVALLLSASYATASHGLDGAGPFMLAIIILGIICLLATVSNIFICIGYYRSGKAKLFSLAIVFFILQLPLISYSVFSAPFKLTSLIPLSLFLQVILLFKGRARHRKIELDQTGE